MNDELTFTVDGINSMAQCGSCVYIRQHIHNALHSKEIHVIVYSYLGLWGSGLAGGISSSSMRNLCMVAFAFLYLAWNMVSRLLHT